MLRHSIKPDEASGIAPQDLRLVPPSRNQPPPVSARMPPAQGERPESHEKTLEAGSRPQQGVVAEQPGTSTQDSNRHKPRSVARKYMA